MKQLFFLFLLANLITSGVDARVRNVWFGDAAFIQGNTHNVTRIYIDRYGSLYPVDSSVYINYEAFNHIEPKADEPQILTEGLRDNTWKAKDNLATLHYYFNYKANHDKWNIWRSKLNWNGYSGNNYYDSFFHLQNIQATLISREVINKCKKGKTTLIILIHGFNDHSPMYDYQLAEGDILNTVADTSAIQFLEVYWDGLTANNGNPAFAKIWGRAQNNSRYVGLRIREILRQSNKDLKVRVLTHSLGASVSNFIFFNPGSLPEPDDDLYRGYFQSDSDKYIPQSDCRVAYLAAAIPGMSTFGTFTRRPDGIFPLQKIIIGHNCNDYALRKNKILKATSVGSTSLGSNYDNEVHNTRVLLSDKGFSNFTDYPFNANPDNRRILEQHSFKYYRKRQQYRVLLHDLLD